MGTCCGAHLQTKIRNYARNAQNGAVTVTVVENPFMFRDEKEELHGSHLPRKCDYCEAPAEFAVSYYPK
jgi:hypothetical protein